MFYGLKAVFQRCSVKKMFLEISQNSQKNTCARVSFLVKLQAWAYNFVKKDTLAQVFYCESSRISKNTFLYRTPLVAASVPLWTLWVLWDIVRILPKSFSSH